MTIANLREKSYAKAQQGPLGKTKGFFFTQIKIISLQELTERFLIKKSSKTNLKSYSLLGLDKGL